MKLMNRFKLLSVVFVLLLSSSLVSAQSCPGGCCSGTGGYVEDGDEIDCIDGPCCTVWNACNATCYNYDPDYSATGGCDLSCAPIDSGVLFILIGGGLFGAFMLNRRRELELVTEEVKS